MKCLPPDSEGGRGDQPVSEIVVARDNQKTGVRQEVAFQPSPMQNAGRNWRDEATFQARNGSAQIEVGRRFQPPWRGPRPRLFSQVSEWPLIERGFLFGIVEREVDVSGDS